MPPRMVIWSGSGSMLITTCLAVKTNQAEAESIEKMTIRINQANHLSGNFGFGCWWVGWKETGSISIDESDDLLGTGGIVFEVSPGSVT